VNDLKPTDFRVFFHDVYGYEPFPWQQRLADRVCAGDWPACIALPTAAGKTACIDIAVFAMAYQAQFPSEKRTAPRRVFFVVDRRVVVDQAYRHAQVLAEKLRSNTATGIIKQVADSLKKIAGCSCGTTCDCRPLDYYALRGGMYRESAWVRSPLQPTIITSTVDQVGSRLLFRGYGVSDLSKPLHAALVGNDALILLDEAHCSRPFEQTVSLIKKYRGWSEDELQAPFRSVSMTATPSDHFSEDQIERDRNDDLAHPVLGPRIKASKPATLIVAEKAKGKTWQQWGMPLVRVLADHARKLKNKGFAAVGVMVNRVATARELADELRHIEARGGSKKSSTEREKKREKDTTIEVILLTGRMRPLDREAVLKQLEPLFCGKSGEIQKPIIVVATQCLEVGADLDFHALVTECASLDALRQRFGRLNRVAARQKAEAVVIVRGDQVEPKENDADSDPVYGNSLAHTWKWLLANKDGDSENGDPRIDFGVASIRQKWEKTPVDQHSKLNAPSPDAAVLLPAHRDLWCQTSPIPVPDPDPAVFLHGSRSGMPDVQVIFRADLGEDIKQWVEIVSLCPPSSSEALSVRLDVFRRWLANDVMKDESSDVEGESSTEPKDIASASGNRQALQWRGPESEETKIIASPNDVRPGQTYILPIIEDHDFSGLGDFPIQPHQPTDQASEAFQRARDLAILRSTDAKSLADLAIDDEAFEEQLKEALESLKSDTREWARIAAANLIKKSNRIAKRHPLGGFVVMGKKRLRRFDPTFVEAEDSWQSGSSDPVRLDAHCDDVANEAHRFAEYLGLPSALRNTLKQSGLLHDAGKTDPRFQSWMHGGNERPANTFPHSLAKSIALMPTKKDRRDARDRAGLPQGFRHEMLSLQLAQSRNGRSDAATEHDLLLHLIAAHHGYARPFAPVVIDEAPPAVTFNGATLTVAQRASLIPPHRLDSGVAERFWKLTRRFGWWGLPWLESMLRLADWAASNAAEKRNINE
jgi:CRISPR-associated endonuclease/helicase Cas3